MKIILESFRFTLIFFVLLTIIGGAVSLICSLIGIDSGVYGYATMIGVFMITLLIYRSKEWGKKVFNPKILWPTIILVILLPMIIPVTSLEHIHTSKYAYSYGFPFTFLTIYIENGAKFLLPNLLSGKITGWSIELGMLANFLLLYFSLQYVSKKLHN